MEFFKYGGIALAALCGLVLLIFAFKSGIPAVGLFVMLPLIFNA